MLLENKYIGITIDQSGDTHVYVDKRYTEPEAMAEQGYTELMLT